MLLSLKDFLNALRLTAPLRARKHRLCENERHGTDDQLGFDFSAERAGHSTAEMESPSGYTGFYRFHKYWGGNPHEPLAYIIEQLTSPGDIVLDPFCGSGTAGREGLLRSRRFIGFDINPVCSKSPTS